MDSRLVVLDLETTGLFPEGDHILEVGMVIAEVVPLHATHIVGGAEFHSLVKPPFEHDAFLAWMETSREYVFNMHKASGLLAELEVEQKKLADVREVEHRCLAFLARHGFKKKEVTLAGNSIHFDRAFIHTHMPELDQFFHHRMVDVSSFRAVASRVVSADIGERVNAVIGDASQHAKHRSLSDCRACIDELALYLRYFLDGPRLWGALQHVKVGK